MKAIDIINYEGKTLAVLVETQGNDETKGFVSYFIDGMQLTDWSKLVSRYQRIFSAMADNLCEGLAVTKWSY
jgi:hypothetical protein